MTAKAWMIGAGLASLAWSGTAQAQADPAAQTTVPPVKDSNVAQPSPDLPNTPPHETKYASIPALEPLARATHRLAQSGVLLRATLTDEYGGNTSGGVHRGTTNTGLGLVGADLDLDTLIGWHGAKVHSLVVFLYGKSVAAEDVGNAIKFQGSYFFPQKTQLAQLSLEQDLFGGKLNIVAGRINATGYFAKPTYGCQFLNGSQCPYYLPLTTGGFSGYPYVTWGGRASVAVAKNTRLSSGVFTIDPTRRNRHGFDVFDTGNVSGVTVPVQLDYGTDFATDRYPRHLMVGGWYNSADYVDPYLNTQRRSRALFAGAPLSYKGGRGGAFALADQVIYRPDKSRRNLAVFGSFAAPFDHREVLASESSLGLLYTGPFKLRPRDTLGLEATLVRFSAKEQAYENDLLTKAGSSSRINRNELMLEANYGFELVRGARITPAVQYIIHPDITALPTEAKRAPGNALVLAVRFGINLGDMLGLPPALPARRR